MKAIALYSGGLDSTLAIALMERLGIEVQPVTYTSPFGDRHGPAGWQKKADRIKQQFNKELLMIPFDDELINLVKQPHFGWGKHLNPCIDCHLQMLRKTRQVLQDLGADFVITGEVLGQRPMSQNKAALELIDRECGLEGLLLRPLSAKVLSPTLPEQKGWVDRNQLLGLQGRSRKPQLALAQAWGISHYGSPAGGCLLTDGHFSKKVKDLMDSGMLEPSNVWWIQPGRYFNLSDHCKLMVARNEDECRRLEELARRRDIVLKPQHIPGPTAVLRGEACRDFVQKAGDIVGFFSKAQEGCEVMVTFPGEQEQQTVITTRAMDDGQVRSFSIT